MIIWKKKIVAVVVPCIWYFTEVHTSLSKCKSSYVDKVLYSL